MLTLRQDKFLKAGRSDNTLGHTKMMTACEGLGEINEIHVAMEKVFQRIRINLEKESLWPDKLPKRA